MGNFFAGDRVVVGATLAPVFTAETDVVVASVLIGNSSGGALPVEVYVSSSVGVNSFLRRVRVPGGESEDAVKGCRVALSAGEKIVASCPVPDAVTAITTIFKD